ncbi:MAG: hypothetical protein NT150_06020 [Bacteroidetes bacterium]|nr:hypothetical protein [Bacteroidota bacterium]
MKLKAKILFIICVSTSVLCYSQVEDTVNNMPTFHREFAGQAFLHTGGFGINVRRGYHITAFKKRIIELDFAGMSHPKSYLIPSSQVTDSKSYVYGQLNSVFVLRTGYGIQKLLAGKTTKSNVEIRLISTAGLSLAILKPTYFEIEAAGNFKMYEKFPSDPNKVVKGGGPYGMGFSEIFLIPGMYGKMALSFEYGGALNKIKAVETGLCFDLYYKEVPILAETKNYPFFVSVYVGLVYGKKWYR